MFLEAVNYEGEFKDRYFIANLLIDSIKEISPQNVVQVITDNAANCKAAELLVEAKFTRIFGTQCVIHTLNLALKNICSPPAYPKYDDVMEDYGWIPKVVSELNELCQEVSRILREMGALLVKDLRCTVEDNDRFIDMKEKYFENPPEFKGLQERLNFHY
ncbi:hypothetical protein LWI28_006528 [Acer negundo]|uniref:DUF659 domain-containing protein n=1 Tax=Acer negundo TaxID=4023 RepID=A0AAD5JPH2_ACENE|nr:hypothetical protein LWI28_006528 [Acer negundo]